MTTYCEPECPFCKAGVPFAKGVDKAPAPTLYRCEGCTRETTDPEADMAALKAGGFLSCCPERKMKPVTLETTP